VLASDLILDKRSVNIRFLIMFGLAVIGGVGGFALATGGRMADSGVRSLDDGQPAQLPARVDSKLKGGVSEDSRSIAAASDGDSLRSCGNLLMTTRVGTLAGRGFWRDGWKLTRMAPLSSLRTTGTC